MTFFNYVSAYLLAYMFVVDYFMDCFSLHPNKYMEKKTLPQKLNDVPAHLGYIINAAVTQRAAQLQSAQHH